MSKHLIKIAYTPHGVLSAHHEGLDQQYCEAGELVTVKNQPSAGWGLQSLYYTTEAGDVVFVAGDTFAMPNSHITLGGIFKRFVLPDWTGSKDDANNVLDWLTAGDITPKTDAPVETSGNFAMQTTGGDMDIANGTARIVSIKGNLLDGVPFAPARFVSTGMNLVDPEQSISRPGAGTQYYFPVAAGAWGEYGTTQENNGYVIIGEGVTSVTFSRTLSGSVSECPYEEHNGTKYYLPPSNGWLHIYVADGYDVPACHIAWSNKYDAVAGEFANDVHEVYTQVAAVHDWGLAGIVTAGRSVFDELDFSAMKGYRRIDRVSLSSLSWAQSTITTDDGTTYVYAVTVSAMAAQGLYECGQFRTFVPITLEVDSNVLTISTDSITTVAALKSAINETYFYYELAAPVEVELSGWDGTFVANDYGLTYFLGYTDDYGGQLELLTVPAYVVAEYQQGGKDQLFNAVTYQAILAEVVATALCQLNERVAALEQRRDIVCTNLTVLRQANLPS